MVLIIEYLYHHKVCFVVLFLCDIGAWMFVTIIRASSILPVLIFCNYKKRDKLTMVDSFSQITCLFCQFLRQIESIFNYYYFPIENVHSKDTL